MAAPDWIEVTWCLNISGCFVRQKSGGLPLIGSFVDLLFCPLTFFSTWAKIGSNDIPLSVSLFHLFMKRVKGDRQKKGRMTNWLTLTIFCFLSWGSFILDVSVNVNVYREPLSICLSIFPSTCLAVFLSPSNMSLNPQTMKNGKKREILSHGGGHHRMWTTFQRARDRDRERDTWQQGRPVVDNEDEDNCSGRGKIAMIDW